MEFAVRATGGPKAAWLLASGCALALLVPAAATARSNRPDLVISKVTFGSRSVKAGNKLKVSDVTKNRGRGKAGLSYTSFFVSRDKKLSYDDIELTSLVRFPDYGSYHKIKSLKAHKSAKGTKKLTIPTYVAQSGAYRVIACADILHHVTESTEANQCKASKRSVKISALPPPGPPVLDSFSGPSNDVFPVVTGKADSGSTVKVYETADCSGPVAGTDQAGSGGGFGVDIEVPEDTVTPLSAKATRNGHTSGCSITVNYDEDSTKPDVTLTTTVPASPGNDTTPDVKGTVTDAHTTTIKLYASTNCSGTPIGTSGTIAAGNPSSFTQTVTVPANDYTSITARATDAAGNSRCSNSIDYQEDSTAPVINSLTTFPTSPASSTTPFVEGDFFDENSADVSIYLSTTCGGTAAATETDSFGFFSQQVTVPANATTSITARATDAAGNVSACYGPISYTSN